MNQLLIMDVFDHYDINLLMSYLDPSRFTASSVGSSFMLSSQTTTTQTLENGLLKLNLDDDIKYEICRLLHSLCDYLLRYRIEAIVSFSSEFVRNIQSDQKRRYNELKESTLPSAIMARKTKEFRCPARDQMQALVNFKSSDSDISEDIKEFLISFHTHLNKLVQIKERDAIEVDLSDAQNSRGFFSRAVSFLFSKDNYNNGDMIPVGQINGSPLSTMPAALLANTGATSANLGDNVGGGEAVHYVDNELVVYQDDKSAAGLVAKIDKSFSNLANFFPSLAFMFFTMEKTIFFLIFTL